MRALSRILIAVAVGALVAPALAGAASTASGTRGVVVVATRSGNLLRVKFAKPGKLAMGTVVKLVGSRVLIVGHAHKAKLHGIVMRRHAHTFALEGNGSVLAVSSPSPPAPGQQVTATVQVTPTELDDDNGDEEVDGQQAASAEILGTVASQTATTLFLNVAGFPASGLPIGLGSMTIPALPVGTPVEARVALGPDPANPNAIILTLVSLHLDNGNHHEHGDFVKAEGKVMAVTEAGPMGGAGGSITIDGEHGVVTFVIPAGFGATGVMPGDDVEAKGTASATPGGNPTLVRLEGGNNNDEVGNSDDNSGNSGGDDSGHGGHSGSGGGDD
jgi:hypothetical protein